jgi:U3 small nucleolar RNA-associated protein 14
VPAEPQSPDEEDEEEEEGEDDEFFDVLDILDGMADVDSEDDSTSEPKKPTPTRKETSIPPKPQTISYIDHSDESEVDEGALSRLGTFIEGLEGGKRKLPEEEAGENRPARQKRRVIEDRNELLPEGEYSTRTGM